MLTINCHGTPCEIGHQHGSSARDAIARTIAFYTDLFARNAQRTWPEVLLVAERFLPTIRERWPAYLEEMTGLATGSSQPLASILALNVRTEIAFGLALPSPPDACTSLSWHFPPGAGEGSTGAFLAQNWDWQPSQKANLVRLCISPSPSPSTSSSSSKASPVRIQMITEAGIIGKIGMNSAGVGVCLNAIKAAGVDYGRLPVHLALRMGLESRSAGEAAGRLEGFGVASACHILVADGGEGIGLEFSSRGGRRVGKGRGGRGRVGHANQFVEGHGEGVEEDRGWLPDSGERVGRVEELCRGLEGGGGEVGMEGIKGIFRDERGLPGAICRAAAREGGGEGVETVFNIVMDLKQKRAEVVVGRPTHAEETFEMSF